MNLFDLLTASIILVFTYLGWERGPAHTILTLLGASVGTLWALANPAFVAMVFQPYTITPPLSTTLGALFCGFAGWLLGRLISAFSPPVTPWSPLRVLAGLVGTAKGLAIASVIYWLILRFHISSIPTSSSFSAPWLEKILQHGSALLGFNI